MQGSVRPSLTEIVRRARKLPTERRFAYLREACHGDHSLYRRAIDSFALQITHAEWWADVPDRAADDPTVGMTIGPYIVAGKIGSGGISDVLLAAPRDRDGPDVAIKVIRRAQASPQLHSRLKVERQILRALDHPNIARLLDGGSTTGGMPYLVMEHLRGEPIDRHCDRYRLTIAERLRLFQPVCRAVHAAHQLAIVHRDLKPSNVLVTAEGVPKLLDFGIAKILDDRKLEQTLVVTHANVRLLTPDYASPEQLRGEAVTPASDVYSLGVLLYELLSGSNPRSGHPQQSRDGPAREDMPPSLTRQLCATTNDSQAALAEVCARRSTVPSRLIEELGGELNNIVMHAMARHPAQRPASAEALAALLDEYLTHTKHSEAGQAQPRPAPWFKVALLSGSLAVLLLLIAIWISVVP